MGDERRPKASEWANGKPPLSERLSLRPAEAAAALGVSERKFRQMLPRLRCVVRDSGTVLIVPDLLREDLHRLAAESEAHKRGPAVEREHGTPDAEAEQFVRALRAKAVTRRERR